MPFYRVVFQFQGGGSQGVSFNEVYYIETGSPAAAAAAVSPSLQQARAAMLSTAYTFTKVRVSDTTQARVSALLTINRQGTYVNAGSPANAPAPADVAVVYNLVSTAVPAKRKVWFRGIGQDTVKWSPTTLTQGLTPNWKNLADVFVTTLAAQKFGIYAHHKASERGFEDHKLVTVLPVTGQTVSTFATIDAHGFRPGDPIIIHRASPKEFPGLNGVWTVLTVPDVTHFVLPYETPFAEVRAFGNGAARSYIPVTGTVIDSAASGFDHVGERKSRSPFTGGRGARRSPLRGLRLSP